jgi:hypothetical protein
LKIQLEKGEISIGEYANTYATLYEQAKEMEKERIENAWITALDYGIGKIKGLNDLESKEAFELYYKQTYGGGEQF